jgi:hypothetical protein
MEHTVFCANESPEKSVCFDWRLADESGAVKLAFVKRTLRCVIGSMARLL